MSESGITPYGSWKSPITSDLIVAGTIGLNEPRLAGDCYWLELRPREGGRLVLVRGTADGKITDLTPEGFSVRTRVHEYGGGAYAVANGTVYFSNFSDQRIYRQDPGCPPRAITPELPHRFADTIIDEQRGLLFCVREDHSGPGEAVNTLVVVNCTGDAAGGSVIVTGNDFYASPRLSPDGTRLAWLTWNHPNMPWDGTELWIGEVKADGSLGRTECVAGGQAESIFQPEWSPEGVLYFISDRSGWWNLYRWQAGRVDALCPMEAEFGQPQWVFGMSSYGFASAGRIICCYTQGGMSHLASLDTATLKLENIAIPYTNIGSMRVAQDQVLFTGGSPTETSSVILLDTATGQAQVLRRSSDLTIDPGYISVPRPIEFPTEDGLMAHAFFYPPRNRDYAAAEYERPPLLVLSHGGPTAATSSVFNARIQYWTSRGIAVVDVNYGGSSGYGRMYRQRLNGLWGVVDVDDCVNAARYLVDRDEVDGRRLAIAGGSAGGYTTLCALTFRDTFSAGASHYGIGDLETLARDTHKFESRYLDNLIGAYPEQRDLYVERSPINHVDLLSCPLIMFQGLEDEVVPPNQAETMLEAVRAKGLPVSYVPFEGEQHGFRKAENIKRALDAELYFYAKIFDFELADPVEPVPIDNL
jgi:dipeptidyl aminopeptidase/acylaminoacyl peptidase